MAKTNHDISLADIDAVAVARGPGLGPCLNVGVNSSKSRSCRFAMPLIGVLSHGKLFFLSDILSFNDTLFLIYFFYNIGSTCSYCSID